MSMLLIWQQPGPAAPPPPPAEVPFVDPSGPPGTLHLHRLREIEEWQYALDQEEIAIILSLIA